MNTDKHLKEWIQEAGREKPSAGFRSQVMDHIAAPSAAPQAYVPVIPPIVLRLIVGGLAGIYIAVLFFLPDASKEREGRYLDQVRDVLPSPPAFTRPLFSLPEIPLDVFRGQSIFAYCLLILTFSVLIIAIQSRFNRVRA